MSYDNTTSAIHPGTGSARVGRANAGSIHPPGLSPGQILSAVAGHADRGGSPRLFDSPGDGAAFGREFDQPGGQRLSVLLPTCGASGIGGIAPGLAVRPPVDCSGASLQRRTTGKALHGGLCAAAGSRLPDDGVWWRAADQRSVSSPGGGSAERPAPNSGGAGQRQEGSLHVVVAATARRTQKLLEIISSGRVVVSLAARCAAADDRCDGPADLQPGGSAGGSAPSGWDSQFAAFLCDASFGKRRGDHGGATAVGPFEPEHHRRLPACAAGTAGAD